MNGMMMKSEDQWEAEHDANTIMEAEKIKGDSSRHLKAQNAMKRMMEEKEKEVADMKKLMGAKMEYKSMKEMGGHASK